MRARRVDHQFNLIQQLQPLRLQFVVGDALTQLPLEVETQLLEARHAAVAAAAVQLMDQIEDLVVMLAVEQCLYPFAHLRQEIEQHLQQIARQSGLLAA